MIDKWHLKESYCLCYQTNSQLTKNVKSMSFYPPKIQIIENLFEINVTTFRSYSIHLELVIHQGFSMAKYYQRNILVFRNYVGLTVEPGGASRASRSALLSARARGCLSCLDAFWLEGFILQSGSIVRMQPASSKNPQSFKWPLV